MNSELEFWKTLAVLLSICLFTTVLFVGLPGIDLWISSLFTNDSGRFFLNWNPYVRFLRSVFIWLITAGIVFSLLMYLTSFYEPGRLKVHRNVWAFVCSSFLLGPGLLVNGILKEYWGRARPQQVLEFGGDANFSSAFSISDQCMQNCSFVSGEGSAAATFAAVLIILIGKNDRVFAWKPLSWLIVAAAGVAAMLRIVLGRHFTSDTIFAILFCTLICVLLYRLFDINRHRREFTVAGVWSDAAGSFPGAYFHAWSSSVKYVRRFAGGVAERARRFTGKV